MVRPRTQSGEIDCTLVLKPDIKTSQAAPAATSPRPTATGWGKKATTAEPTA
ncbi:hypothetical protein D3C72_2477330 [compost metagenome]